MFLKIRILRYFFSPTELPAFKLVVLFIRDKIGEGEIFCYFYLSSTTSHRIAWEKHFF